MGLACSDGFEAEAGDEVDVACVLTTGAIQAMASVSRSPSTHTQTNTHVQTLNVSDLYAAMTLVSFQ